MAIQTDGILFDTLSADPGSPVEGQCWYNSTTFLFKVYRNGAITSFTDAATFAAHAGSTSNPHATTLEQARSSGATLAGAINMGGFAINNIAAGSTGTDGAQRQWVTDQINSRIAGLDWQDPVINSLTTPPGSPVTGDRYRVIATATGAWATKEDQIAQWSGSAWVFTVPVEGFILRDMTSNTYLVYDGTGWANLGNAVQHSALLGLTTGDDHTQYQLRSEKGASNGYAGLTGTSITDATHGNRGGGALHSTVSASGAGFMPQSNLAATTNPGVGNDNTQGYIVGSEWLNTTAQTAWVCLGNATGAAVWKELTNTAGMLPTKAGKVLGASFSGNPKKATVTFATPFADANYTVVVTGVTNVSGNGHVPSIESQLAGSFVINLETNSISTLISANWIATKHGESA